MAHVQEPVVQCFFVLRFFCKYMSGICSLRAQAIRLCFASPPPDVSRLVARVSLTNDVTR